MHLVQTKKNSSSSFAAILLSFVSSSSSSSIFSHPPSEPDFFSYPTERAIFRIRRGCRRLNDRSTLLATLFADRFAGLVVVFTYPRERGQLGGVPRAAVKEDRESFDCQHEETCVGATSLGPRVTEDSFPELCSHKCVHSFPPPCSTGARCLPCYRRNKMLLIVASVASLTEAHLPLHREIKEKRDELGA